MHTLNIVPERFYHLSTPNTAMSASQATSQQAGAIIVLYINYSPRVCYILPRLLQRRPCKVQRCIVSRPLQRIQ